MPLALEMLIVPVLLLTIIAVVLIAADAGLGAAIAGLVGLGVLYFVFVNVLRTARREEGEPGDDQASDD